MFSKNQISQELRGQEAFAASSKRVGVLSSSALAHIPSGKDLLQTGQ
jgi:hypothetical protein